MRAELKSLYSTEVDLRSYVPSDEAFSVNVTAEIGQLGGEGADNFEIEVCSPRWLERAVDRDKVVSGRHRLFMDGFNFDALESYVLKRVRQAEGSNWESVAEKLSRWALWEFEDYRP